MSTNLIRFLVAVSLVACGGASPDDAEDTTSTADTTDGTDTTDTTEATDTTDTTGETGDTDGAGPATTEPVDTTDPNALPASELVGRFLANAPTSACYAQIFNQTVVEITEIDADSVNITDGTVTFTCDISGTELVCPPAVGTTTSIQIAQFEWCDWPYTATVDIQNVAADSFFVDLSFVTSPATGGPNCANAFGVCNGQAAAAFTRIEETPGVPQAPAKAMVSP